MFKLLLFRYFNTIRSGAVGYTQKAYTCGRTLRCEFETRIIHIFFYKYVAAFSYCDIFLVLELTNAVFLVFCFIFLFVLFSIILFIGKICIE